VDEEPAADVKAVEIAETVVMKKFHESHKNTHHEGGTGSNEEED